MWANIGSPGVVKHIAIRYECGIPNTSALHRPVLFLEVSGIFGRREHYGAISEIFGFLNQDKLVDFDAKQDK